MKGVEGDLQTNFLSRGPSRDAVLSGCIVSVDLCVCWCCGSIFIYGSRVFLGSVCVTPEQLRPWRRVFSPLWSVFLSVVFQGEWGNAGAPPQSRPRTELYTVDVRRTRERARGPQRSGSSTRRVRVDRREGHRCGRRGKCWNCSSPHPPADLSDGLTLRAALFLWSVLKAAFKIKFGALENYHSR